MGALWGLGGPHGGAMGPGGTLGVSVAMGSERILWESAGLREDPMGPGGILWVSVGLWEDPMGVNGALGRPRGDLWGLGESYGSQWGSGRNLWGSYGVWEDPKGSNAVLGGPYGGPMVSGRTSG